MEHRINKLFHRNVEATMEMTETLSATISLVAQKLANTLLNDGKIIVVGNGESGAIGQLFVSSLINGLHYERPSLPAISLQVDSTIITSIAEHNGTKEIFAKQIRALGNSCDLLLVIVAKTQAKNIDQAILAAQEKNLPVVALSNQSNSMMETVLGPEDLLLAFPDTSLAATYQAQLQVLLALTDLIDFQLFGVGDSL